MGTLNRYIVVSAQPGYVVLERIDGDWRMAGRVVAWLIDPRHDDAISDEDVQANRLGSEAAFLSR